MDTSKFDFLYNRIQFINGIYQNKLKSISSLKEELDNLYTERDLLNKSEKVLKHLLDKLVKKDLSIIENLITYGLKTVYCDRNLEFKTEIKDFGRKIWIDLQTFSEGNKIDPQSQSSVQVIESFLLRLLCIIKLKRIKLLLLDETFAAVDSGYIENLGLLISQLCDRLNMDVLLVTHNMGFLDFSKHTYRIEKVEGKISLSKLK